jgi:hypothetical protein
VELESIPQQIRERIEQIGSADLVVGFLVDRNGETGAAISVVREALATLSAGTRTVIIQNDGAKTPVSTEPPGVEEDTSFVLLSGVFGTDASVTPVQSMSDAYRSIFAVGERLGVRACCVVASDLQTVTSRWISLLAQPVLEMDFDLVMPCYAHRKFEGLLNSSVIGPLSRALYGQRIQNPLGPDLGFSRQVLQRMLGTDSAVESARHPLASLAPTAINGGFQICQAQVGTRLYPPTDWMNLSSLLAQILGPIFLEMERNAAAWQRTRGSQPVPGFGEPAPISEEAGSINVHHMIESFQLGTRDLREIWGLVLPPATLFELSKLSRLAPEQFRMPDELWVRIVYDFALGHRLRSISRDHLLRALTPLYLGWVASYALELETAGAVAVEQRLERLSLAYEAAKPYLVSRWRWPDRFNP